MCPRSLCSVVLLLSDKQQAELALQHVGIEHRHLRVEEGKAEVMAVRAFAVTGERRDAEGMGERACLPVNLTFQPRVEEQMTEGAVDA